MSVALKAFTFFTLTIYSYIFADDCFKYKSEAMKMLSIHHVNLPRVATPFDVARFVLNDVVRASSQGPGKLCKINPDVFASYFPQYMRNNFAEVMKKLWAFSQKTFNELDENYPNSQANQRRNLAFETCLKKAGEEVERFVLRCSMDANLEIMSHVSGKEVLSFVSDDEQKIANGQGFVTHWYRQSFNPSSQNKKLCNEDCYPPNMFGGYNQLSSHPFAPDSGEPLCKGISFPSFWLGGVIHGSQVVCLWLASFPYSELNVIRRHLPITKAVADVRNEKAQKEIKLGFVFLPHLYDSLYEVPIVLLLTWFFALMHNFLLIGARTRKQGLLLCK